ncbi:hypothetical protein DFH27DRAFT_527266 [Peziza echinospora]|nr:hypothetical protein DFH27DRAFT_527266 [Peziza echinospora]
MTLGPTKSWAFSLTVQRALRPPIIYQGTPIAYADSKVYTGWTLDVPARGRKVWDSRKHLKDRLTSATKTANTLMSLEPKLGTPSSSFYFGLFRNLVEPDLIFAAEASFDCAKSTSMEHDSIQARFARFALGLNRKNRSQRVIISEFGVLTMSLRRLQLAARFYTYAATQDPSRLIHKALLDSIDLANTRSRGWFYELNERVKPYDPEGLPLPCQEPEFVAVRRDEPDPPETVAWSRLMYFARELEWSMFRLQHQDVMRDMFNKRSLNLLALCQWDCTALMRQGYTMLKKSLARAVARMRLSDHNLMVERGRWNGTPWEDRVCPHCEGLGIREVEDEIHVLFNCPLFVEERVQLRRKFGRLSGYTGFDKWSRRRQITLLLCPTGEATKPVAIYIHRVLSIVDKRYPL